MGLGLWLEFISVGSSQFIGRYLIRLDTQHLPANIHKILLQPLIGQQTFLQASYWPGSLGLSKVQTCIKVALEDSHQVIAVDKSDFLSDIFSHFPNVLGRVLYPGVGSREAINRLRVTNSPSAIGM